VSSTRTKLPNASADAELLAALPPPLRQLASAGIVRRYRARTTLIEEGDEGSTLLIVLSGALRIFCTGPSGREITLAVYGPGEYVGEMSLDGGLRSASVETDIASVCAVVNGRTLRAFLARSPEFSFELIVRLIRRTRLATANARSLALLDAYGRMANLFDSLAEPHTGSKRIIKQWLTHREISERIGCSRELVSRLLKDLERGGFLLTEQRQIIILKRLPQRW
jgi:CRP/FNR family transcriptional regulator, cyclic AMP receptor protein